VAGGLNIPEKQQIARDEIPKKAFEADGVTFDFTPFFNGKTGKRGFFFVVFGI